MYDPTTLARYYASRAQSFVDLANEGSSLSRTIYLRLAEVFDGLAISAARFAAELRGEAHLEQKKMEREAPVVPAPSRSKRKPASRKRVQSPARFTDSAAIDEVRH